MVGDAGHKYKLSISTDFNEILSQFNKIDEDLFLSSIIEFSENNKEIVVEVILS